ncbi:MAG: hypothetical protein VB061_08415 [Christensenella sp.]|nr:hypothetical protein [Christensenella sp.]
MSSEQNNLLACFEVLKNEYQFEEARQASITTRSGNFLQFGGVLAGLCFAQLISPSPITTIDYVLLATFSTGLFLSACSIILMAIAMKANNYLRFPHKTINIDAVREMSEIEYIICLIEAIQKIISFNQNQNSKRLCFFSWGVGFCTATTILFFAAIAIKALWGA